MGEPLQTSPTASELRVPVLSVAVSWARVGAGQQVLFFFLLVYLSLGSGPALPSLANPEDWVSFCVLASLAAGLYLGLAAKLGHRAQGLSRSTD